MDHISKTNRDRWNALANANVMYSRPFLDYTVEQAAAYVCRYGILEAVQGKRVLCLASGGGQDSVAFGLLGAEVTVLDLSEVQLSRDRAAAQHHGLSVTTVQGDMRDLSAFASSDFDIVWQPYSVNYSPAVEPVFREVARVLKDGGCYHVTFANPFTLTLDDRTWNGSGYLLRGLYRDGEDISPYEPYWEVEQADGSVVRVPSPHHFRHTLSTVLNALARHGFVFLHLEEWMRAGEDPEPGSWVHYTQAAPPWFETFWRLSKTE